MIHVDKLNVSEVHADCPMFTDVRVMKWRDDTGEEICNTGTGKQVVGSWDASFRGRAVGGKVSVEGNPSKWNRLDAVTGCRSVEAAIGVYNGVLDQLGLPRFSEDIEEKRFIDGIVVRRAPKTRLVDGTSVSRGPTIHRIELTRNVITGGPDQARWFINFVLGHKWGRLEPITFGEQSIAYGSLKRRQLAYYNKAEEIRKNFSKTFRALSSGEKEKAKVYLEKLANWCEEIGLVREEVRYGRNALIEREWRDVVNWYGVDLEERFDKTVREMAKGGASVLDWKEELFNRVLSETGSPRQAKAAQDLLVRWMNGLPVDQGISRRTFYRYAKLLRELCTASIFGVHATCSRSERRWMWSKSRPGCCKKAISRVSIARRDRRITRR